MMKTNFTISPVDMEARRRLPLRAGATVRVKQKIVEGDKTRSQAFEGLLIARRHGTEPGATFTVRRVAGGFGLEKTFPLYSPRIEQIEILKQAKARRSKLFYVREKTRKDIRRKVKQSELAESIKLESTKEEPKLAPAGPTEENKEAAEASEGDK